jgi:hypothetical protein
MLRCLTSAWAAYGSLLTWVCAGGVYGNAQLIGRRLCPRCRTCVLHMNIHIAYTTSRPFLRKGGEGAHEQSLDKSFLMIGVCEVVLGCYSAGESIALDMVLLRRLMKAIDNNLHEIGKYKVPPLPLPTNVFLHTNFTLSPMLLKMVCLNHIRGLGHRRGSRWVVGGTGVCISVQTSPK